MHFFWCVIMLIKCIHALFHFIIIFYTINDGRWFLEIFKFRIIAHCFHLNMSYEWSTWIQSFKFLAKNGCDCKPTKIIDFRGSLFDFKRANEIFQQKGEMSFFQKTCFLGVWCRKLSLSKIGLMDMSYIMDSGQNGLYTTFPNIFSLLSADSADLSQIPKNHDFSQKMTISNFLINRPDRPILIKKS